MNAFSAQYDPETMKKAEFIARVFSKVSANKDQELMGLVNTYIDGISAGLRLAESKGKKRDTA